MTGRVDLHRHLDGSLRPDTGAELAAQRGLRVPDDLLFFPGMGLEAALARFAFTLSLLDTPDAVTRVASEIAEDAAADGVTVLEVRFAPQLHGDDPARFVDAAVDGLAGRAGLILCGLYGEPPEVLDRLVGWASSRRGVVGIDLAGGPAPGHRFGLRDYAPAFSRARDLGLGRTVHAGEGRPPAEIRLAVEQLHAQRIGHGTTVLDDPAVAELVARRGILLEACLTSNAQVGVIPTVDDHPLARWIEHGIRACICTDNTLLSATTSSQESRLAARLVGDAAVERLHADAGTAAFRR